MKMAGLHEHARRAAGRIEHEAVIRPMTLTIMRTSDGGVKNSPPSCAPLMANLLRKYS